MAILSITLIIITLIFSTAQKLKDQNRKELKQVLTGVLKITQGTMHFWKEDLKADQIAIAGLPRIRQLIQTNNISENTKKSLEEILKPSARAHKYLDYAIYVLNKEGTPRPLFEQKPLFQNILTKSESVIKQAFAGSFSIGIPQHYSGAYEMVTVTACPIKNESGKIIGALVFLVDLYTKFSDATQLGRLGESGETYALNQAGQMVTPSRFSDDPNIDQTYSLIKHPLIKDYEILTSNHYGYNLDGYKDYRGITVIGAWTWDDEIKLGLVTEIDKEEAYRSYEIIKRLIWAMVFIVIAAMVSLLLFREFWTRTKINNLRQKEEARKELLSIVSHDLKSPLNALLILNDLLIKNMPQNDQSSDRSRKLLEKSYQVAENMKKMIHDLLDASRIEAGKLEINPVKCSGESVLNQSLELIEPSATAKNITIEKLIPSDLPPLLADSERLAQIFSNLLSNAVKFTYPEGHIEIQAKAIKSNVEFSIRDNGPGISPKDQERLFERFWQAEKSKKLGTGLGLSICKELVLAHGGKIWFESKLGKGTTFFFTIPIWNSKLTS